MRLVLQMFLLTKKNNSDVEYQRKETKRKLTYYQMIVTSGEGELY